MKAPIGFNNWFEVFAKILLEGGPAPLPVDKSALKDLLDLIHAEDLKEDDYTPETWEPFKNALQLAEFIYEDSNATQEEVDEIVVELSKSFDSLEPRVECVYPLDIKPDLVNLLGFEPFVLHDPCGHKLFSSGNLAHLAISQEAAVALTSGGQIPESSILPPNYLGDGIYAVEYYVRVQAMDSNDAGLTIALGGSIHSKQGVNGGNLGIIYEIYDGQEGLLVGALSYDNQAAYRRFENKSIIRVGLYYNTATKEVGFIIEGEDIGYLGQYAHDEPLILYAAKSGVMPEYNLNAEVNIEVFTKGEDLQFTYPNNTKGLDGELVPRVKCVYPLDATEEQLNIVGYSSFEIQDDCGHKLAVTTQDTALLAISKRIADDILLGLPVPNDEHLPPRHLGEGIFCVEFKLNWKVKDHEEFTFDTFNIGRSDIAYSNAISYVSIVQGTRDGTKFSSIVAYNGDSTGDEYRINTNNEFVENITIGLYYNTNTKQIGVVTDLFGDVGYIGEYPDSTADVLVVNKELEAPKLNGADFNVEVLTEGEKLTLYYPEGSVGLDGEPVPVAPEPPKPNPITNSITVIPVARPDNLTTVQYYVGDMEADPDPIGILVDESGWSLGKVKLVGSVYTPDGANPYINTIRVLLDPDEQVPTRYDLKINGKMIPTSARYIQPTATPNMLSFLTIMDNQEDLFDSEVEYTVEVLAYYD